MVNDRLDSTQSEQRSGLTHDVVVVTVAANSLALPRRFIAKDGAGVGARVSRHSPTTKVVNLFLFL